MAENIIPLHGQDFKTRASAAFGRGTAQGLSNLLQTGLDRMTMDQLSNIQQHQTARATERDNQLLYNQAREIGLSDKEARILPLVGRSNVPKFLMSAFERGFQPGYQQQPAQETPAPASSYVQPGQQRTQGAQTTQPQVVINAGPQQRSDMQQPQGIVPGVQRQNQLQQGSGQPQGIIPPQPNFMQQQQPTGSLSEAYKRGNPLSAAQLARYNQTERQNDFQNQISLERSQNDKARIAELTRHNEAQEQAAADALGVKKEQLTTQRSDAQQLNIDKQFKKYDDNLQARYAPAEQAVQKLGEMKELLLKGDEVTGSRVSSGLKGQLPYALQNTASKRFNDEGEDVASLLAGLQTGAQTISKIKFNKSRKPNLTQDTATQFLRVDDALQEVGKVVLERDIRDYLVSMNDSKIPKDLTGKINKIYNKSPKIPPVPNNAEQGDIFNDDKTGLRWIVSGPLMRFHGFIEEGK